MHVFGFICPSFEVNVILFVVLENSYVCMYVCIYVRSLLWSNITLIVS